MKKLSLVVFSLVLVCSCGSETQQEPIQQPPLQTALPNSEQPSEVLFSSSKSRIETEVNEQDLALWTEHLNNITLSRFNESLSNSNSLVMPYHEISLFALLSTGAAGDSLDEINEHFALGVPAFSSQQDLLLSSLNTFDQNLNRMHTDGVSTYSSSKQFWGQQDYPFSSDFLDTLVMYSNAELNPVDFSADSKVVSLSYNEHIFDATSEQIPFSDSHLVTENDFERSVLFMTHTSLLDAKWEHAFPIENTTVDNFQILDGEIIQTPLMQINVSTQLYEDDSSFLVALPSNDANWTVYFVSSTNLEDYYELTEYFNFDMLNNMIAQSSLADLILTVPSFSIETQHHGFDSVLNMPTYLSFNLSSVYDDTSADLSKINKSGVPELYLSDLKANYLLNLDEQGLSVASELNLNIKKIEEPFLLGSGFSSTFGGFGDITFLSDSDEVRAINLDRPFMYFVYHNPTGTVMYSGQITNPLE